jgi:hypothetical protein
MWARFRAETGEVNEAASQVLEAIPIVRKALPPLSATLWSPLTCTSHVLNLAGRFAEAEPYARQELAIMDAEGTPETDARRAESLYELSTALFGKKKYREATPMLERSARIYRECGPTWAARAAELKALIDERKRATGQSRTTSPQW